MIVYTEQLRRYYGTRALSTKAEYSYGMVRRDSSDTLAMLLRCKHHHTISFLTDQRPW